MSAQAAETAKEEPLTPERNAHERQVCRAVADYDTPFPNPLVVRAGEQLTVGKRESEWPGWIWCTTRQGHGGWVPESFVTRQGDACTLRRNYDATELSVRVGEELVVEGEESGWLWCAMPWLKLTSANQVSPASRAGWCCMVLLKLIPHCRKRSRSWGWDRNPCVKCRLMKDSRSILHP